MATNLVHNIKDALQGFSVRNAYCWLHSTVALYWIRGSGEYKQFVGNRVRRIQLEEYIECRHVGTEKNPDDLGSWGSEVNQTSKLWWRGPEWLSEPANLPPDIITSVTKETKVEAKTLKGIFAVALQALDEPDQIMGKWDLWKAIRVSAWVSWVTHNTRNNRKNTTNLETSHHRRDYQTNPILDKKGTIQKRRNSSSRTNCSRIATKRLGVYQCRGRIEGLPNIPTRKWGLHRKISTERLHAH